MGEGKNTRRVEIKYRMLNPQESRQIKLTELHGHFTTMYIL